MKGSQLKQWVDWIMVEGVETREGGFRPERDVTEERQSSAGHVAVNRQDDHAEWNMPIPRSDNEKQTALDKMNKRHANAQNLFTGEPLEGQDLKDWQLLERQRAYSLEVE